MPGAFALSASISISKVAKQSLFEWNPASELKITLPLAFQCV
jgi:hypothetical protein